MANQEQLRILKQGVEVWNKWRKENPDLEVDLREADLKGAWLMGVDLTGADLREADLMGAELRKVNLSGARLARADLSETNLREANLSEANCAMAFMVQSNFSGTDLRGVNFSRAILVRADFSGANLSEASLAGANLMEANLNGADLRNAMLLDASLVQTSVSNAKISGSWVYGVNVWDLKGEFEEQKDLIITPDDNSIITVDNIKVAQFIYLILNNEEIRDVINTLTSKSVLILGRFALPERKIILDTLRNKLREYDLLPIVFDFDRPTDKDFTETIKTLAGLSYFVIADVTNPKSSPLELQATVPDYQIPFVPIIQDGESPFAMMIDLQKKYNWVLNTVSYDSKETLIKVLKPLIIDPAMNKRNELRLVKAQIPDVISGRDFLAKGDL